MPIPQEILKIKRPRNTFVVAYGKSKDLYAVRQYAGCRYDNGRHLPIKGPTIGHIINGSYIPKEEKKAISAVSRIDLRDWGNIVLCDRVFNPIIKELEQEYHHDDALKLYCISILRVCYPGICDYELADYYQHSYLSILYPNVALSKNTVSKFLKNLGETCSQIIKFMQDRASSIGPNDHILIDGTLKTNESSINSLSDFSRKTRVKGSRDISIIYAFDMDKMEPVCSKCYPGNMLDVNAYEDFISTNKITRGVVVADKGFPANAAEGYRSKNPDLHYLNPIKRNATFIRTHHMLEFANILPGRENVQCKKAKVAGKNKWLYAYRDINKAANEEKAYLARAQTENGYDYADYTKQKELFGTIVLECDLDLDPLQVYKMYEERWQIELVMRYYKSACEFDVTRVHDDYSVIGSEFCDFLSSVLTHKLIKSFDQIKLLHKYTYSKIMKFLRRAKKVSIDSKSWSLINISPSLASLLLDLGLTQPEGKSVKNRGSSSTQLIDTSCDPV